MKRIIGVFIIFILFFNSPIRVLGARDVEGVVYIDALFDGRYMPTIEETVGDRGDMLAVALKNEDTGVLVSTVDTENGRYLFTAVDTGNYTVAIIPPKLSTWEYIPLLSFYRVQVLPTTAEDTDPVEQDIAVLENSFMGCQVTLTLNTTQVMTLQYGDYNFRYYSGWCVNASDPTCATVDAPTECLVQAISSKHINIGYRGRIELGFYGDYNLTGLGPSQTGQDAPSTQVTIIATFTYNGHTTKLKTEGTTLDKSIIIVPFVDVQITIETLQSYIVLYNGPIFSLNNSTPNVTFAFAMYDIFPFTSPQYNPVRLYSQPQQQGPFVSLPAGIYQRDHLIQLGLSMSVLSFVSPYKYRVYLSVSTSPSAPISNIPLNGYFVESNNTGRIIQIQITSNTEMSKNPIPLMGGIVKFINVYYKLFKPKFYLTEFINSDITGLKELDCVYSSFGLQSSCQFPSRVGKRFIRTVLNDKTLYYSEPVYYFDYFTIRQIDAKLIKKPTKAMNLTNQVFNWVDSNGTEGNTTIIGNLNNMILQVGNQTLLNVACNDGNCTLFWQADGNLVYKNGTSKVLYTSDTNSLTPDYLAISKLGVSTVSIDGQTRWGYYHFDNQLWRKKPIHPIIFTITNDYLDAADPNRKNLLPAKWISNGRFFAFVNDSKLVLTSQPSSLKSTSPNALGLFKDGSLCWYPTSTTSTTPVPGCLAKGGYGGRYLIVAGQETTWSTWALNIVDEQGRLVWAMNSTTKKVILNIPMQMGTYLTKNNSLYSNDSRSFITNGVDFFDVNDDGNLIIYENNAMGYDIIMQSTSFLNLQDAPYRLQVQSQGLSLTSASYPNDPYWQLPSIAGMNASYLFMYPQAGDMSALGTSLSYGALLVDDNGKVAGGIAGGQDMRANYINCLTATIARTNFDKVPQLSNGFLKMQWDNRTGVIIVKRNDTDSIVWSSPSPTFSSVNNIYSAGLLCTTSSTPDFCIQGCTLIDPATNKCTAQSEVWRPLQSSTKWFGLIIGFPELVIVDTNNVIQWSAGISTIQTNSY